MLPKNKRLSSKEILLLPQNKRKRLKTTFFDFIIFPSDSPKFAFLISSKIIRKAVTRNFLKRRIANILESNQKFFNLKKAVLIIIKNDFSDASSGELVTQLEVML